MKYWLLHCTHGDLFEDFLVEGDPNLIDDIEILAVKRGRGWMWPLGWLKFSQKAKLNIIRALKEGVYQVDKSRYEARGVSEEEATLILFEAGGK